MDVDTLLVDYKSLVYHLIYRTVYDRNVHDELFQEVFLQIFKGITGFKGKSRLSTWIASVTLHTCFNHIKKIGKHQTLSLDQWLEEGGEVDTESCSAQHWSEMEEAGRKIEAALDQLTNKYKVPLVLFYIEHYTYKEIAAVLGCPVGTVKANLFRGLKELRKRLGGDIHEFM